MFASQRLRPFLLTGVGFKVTHHDASANAAAKGPKRYFLVQPELVEKDAIPHLSITENLVPTKHLNV